MCQLAGLSYNDLHTKFWRRRGAPQSPSDCVLRTIGWSSRLGYIWIMVHISDTLHILYVLQLGRYYHTLLLKLHNLRFKLQRQHKFSHKSSQDQTIHERSWIPKHKVLVHASLESAGCGWSTPSTRQDHDHSWISNYKISHVFFLGSCQSTSKTQSTQTAARTRLCESMQTHCAETLEQLFFLNYASDLLFHSQNFQSSSCKGLDVSISCGLGQFPFNMARAADCIDDLANNVIGRYPVLDVSMSDSQVCSSTCISMCPNHFIFWPAQVCSNNVPGSRAWDSVAASCARTWLGTCNLNQTREIIQTNRLNALFDSCIPFFMALGTKSYEHGGRETRPWRA